MRMSLADGDVLSFCLHHRNVNDGKSVPMTVALSTGPNNNNKNKNRTNNIINNNNNYRHPVIIVLVILIMIIIRRIYQ